MLSRLHSVASPTSIARAARHRAVGPCCARIHVNFLIFFPFGVLLPPQPPGGPRSRRNPRNLVARLDLICRANLLSLTYRADLSRVAPSVASRTYESSPFLAHTSRPVSATPAMSGLPPGGLPPPNDSLWQEHRTPDGRLYYYNPVTKDTQWTKPMEMMSPAEVCLLQNLGLSGVLEPDANMA